MIEIEGFSGCDLVPVRDIERSPARPAGVEPVAKLTLQI